MNNLLDLISISENDEYILSGVSFLKDQKIDKAIEELKSGKVEVVGTGDELKAKGSVTNLEGEL